MNKEKKTANGKKTAARTKKDRPEKKPVKKSANEQQQKPEQKKKPLIARIFCNAYFWSAVLAAVFLLIGLNVFKTDPVPPEKAVATLQAAELRYGSTGEISLQFDKPVDFDGKEQVVWFVDGKEVQKGFTSQTDILTLKHDFSSVGRHMVRAEVTGYDNLTVESGVEVKKPLLTLTVEDAQKIYGEDTPSPRFKAEGFVDGDSLQTIDLATPTFEADKNSSVGKYGVKPVENARYDVTIKGGTLEVKPRQLRLKGKISKVYDGTTAATDFQLSLDGVLNGDDVSLKTSKAEYVDKNAGTGKKVLLSAVTEGKDAHNYTLPSSVDFGEITPKTLHLQDIAVADKVFDGGTSATFSRIGAPDGVVFGDEIGIGKITARFDASNIGTDIPVHIDCCEVKGKDAGNYTLRLPQDLTADITK